MTEPSRRPRKRKTAEPSLFRNRGEASYDGPALKVLSSNFTLGPLLARGCLVSSDAGPGPFTTTSERFEEGAVTSLIGSARNVIPIGIELKTGRTVRSVASPHVDGAIEALCFSDVEAILFRNEKEKARFTSVEFSNYSLETLNLPCKVSSDSFPVPEDTALAVSVAPAEPSIASDLSAALRRAESLAGLVAYFFNASPGRAGWMRGVQALTGNVRRGSSSGVSWPERISRAVGERTSPARESDDVLLAATIEVLSRLPVEDGWPSHEVLRQIRDAAARLIPAEDQKATRDIEIWADRALEILDAKAEPSSLADDAHVLPRAALLLLLRGDIDAIFAGIAASTGNQKAGPQVLGIAGALAAYRAGLRALPNRCKSGPDRAASTTMLSFLGELFLALLQSGANDLFPANLPRPQVTYRRIKALQGEWVVDIEGTECARIPATFDSGLERLLTMGRDLGFEFEEHGDSGLVTKVVTSDGKSRPVYLKVLKGETVGGAVVRFSSPTLKLVGPNSKSKLSKEVLLNLLIRNADADMNCRFAIEDDESVIVVLVDQLLGTLDEAEFRKHVHHVAHVAADFEFGRATVAEVS